MGERLSRLHGNRPHVLNDDVEPREQQIHRTGRTHILDITRSVTFADACRSSYSDTTLAHVASPHRLRHEDPPYGNHEDGARSWTTGVSMRISPR